MRVGFASASHDLNRLHGFIVVNFDLRQVASDSEPLPIARVIDALVLILGVEDDLLAAVVHEVTPPHDRPVHHRPQEHFILLAFPRHAGHRKTCLCVISRCLLRMELVEHLIELCSHYFD